MSCKSSASIAPAPAIINEGNNRKRKFSKIFAALHKIKWGKRFTFYITVITTNLLLAISFLVTVFVSLIIVTSTEPPMESEMEQRINDTLVGQRINETHVLIGNGLSRNPHCPSFITWSLLVEFGAQIVYTTGSVFLFAGAIRKRKRYCQAYLACGIASLVISTLIRFSELMICETYVPRYVKLGILWLVYKRSLKYLSYQYLWYWLIVFLVFSHLDWIEKEGVKEMKRIKSAAMSVKSLP